MLKFQLVFCLLDVGKIGQNQLSTWNNFEIVVEGSAIATACGASIAKRAGGSAGLLTAPISAKTTRGGLCTTPILSLLGGLVLAIIG
jgi:hypothetical protein